MVEAVTHAFRQQESNAEETKSESIILLNNPAQPSQK